MNTHGAGAPAAAASGLIGMRAQGPELALDIGNDLAATEAVLQAVREHLAAQGAGERGIYNAELVVEEIFTNAVRHGFDSVTAHRIVIRVVASADAIQIEFDDDGREFDPTLRPDPVLPATVQEAKIGGLGLMLVRKLSQAIAYRRKDGRNQLSVTLASK
jgi:serine/threonine-protein kinase RsbW